MDTPTITQLKELREAALKNIKKIKASDFESEKFGSEGEYSAKGVISGVTAILIDIGALVKTPAKFIRISTHKERSDLVTQLTNINTASSNRDISKLALYIDAIKPVLRALGVRDSDERREEFLLVLDTLQRRATNLSESISTLEETLKTSEQLKENIEETYSSLLEKEKELVQKENEIEKLQENCISTKSKLDKILEIGTTTSEEIEDALSTVKSHEELILNFSKKISQRETQLEDQTTKANNFEKSLISYRHKQEELITVAAKLIESAKAALGYKTAEGISAAFNEKYTEARTDKSTNNWIFAAGSFFIAAIAIGIWVVAGNSEIGLTTLIGRITLIPILLGGSWFSASQYIKQKNLAEDYAYKSVLARSIVGFSEQLSTKTNKGEDYSYYVKSVLEEIHQDPLGRKKNASTKPDNETNLEKILDGVSNVTEKVEKLVKSLKPSPRDMS